MNSAEIVLEARDVSMQYPGTLALDDVTFQLRRGQGQRAHRRKRRGQIHAGQYPGGYRPADARHAAAGWRGDRAALGARCRRPRDRHHPPGIESVPEPQRRGEHLPGARVDRRAACSTRSEQERAGARTAGPAGASDRPCHAGRRTAARPAADRRDRQSAGARCAGAHDGRADLRAQRRGNRGALPHHSRSEGAGRRDRLHLAPPGGTARDRGHCLRTARRPHGGGGRGRRRGHALDRRTDDRPAGRSAAEAAGHAEPGAELLRVERAAPCRPESGRPLLRDVSLACAPAKSWASTD